jgi:hypothetical protein
MSASVGRRQPIYALAGGISQTVCDRLGRDGSWGRRPQAIKEL